MEEKDFCVGNRIQHEKYGEGIISENKDLTFKVIFVRGGEVEFSKMNASFEVVKPNVNEDGDLRPRLDVKEFERALTFILGKYNAIENRVDDEWCTMQSILADNAEVLSLAKKHNVNYILIDNQYEINIDL